MKRQVIPTLALVLTLFACTNDDENVFHDVMTSSIVKDEFATTRACSLNKPDSDSIVPIVDSDFLRRLKLLLECNRPKRANGLPSDQDHYHYDDFFSDNMYAIREMPVTIKARAVASGCNSAYCYFSCDGAGKEVQLSNNSYSNNSSFYIKILPPSSGIPYLLYSSVSKTPLRVCCYKGAPDDKILMSSISGDTSLFGAGWNLNPASTNGYFSIQSNDYLAQDDPNNWMSIFYYVLEASANNRISYAKRVANKAQQEFYITPRQNFSISDVTFDLDNATITDASDFIYKKSLTNEDDFDAEQEVSIKTKANETSRFEEKPSKIKITITVPNNFRVPYPQAVARQAVIFENGNPTTSYSTYTTSSPKDLDYTVRIVMKANSLMQLTVRFKRFNLSVPFVLSAKYGDRIFKIRGVWHGTLVADPKRNAPTLEPRFYDLETGQPVNYSLEFNKIRKLYIVK